MMPSHLQTKVRAACLPLAFVCVGVRSSRAEAQASAAARCPARVGPAVGPLAGRRIAEVRIVTQGPVALPGGVGALLHVTTREETIRSRLLFAAGDALDTLRVAESVRRLRRLRYLHGAAVMASCDSAGGVVLAVVTRDAWSMQPRLSADGSGTAVAGLEETNLLGTGRAGRIYARSDHGQLGVGAAYSDPSLLGARLVTTISHDSYGDGSAWSASAQTREAGVFDAWGFSAIARKSARRTVTPAPGVARGDSVYRTSAAVLARRRLSLTSGTATYLLVGADLERTMVVSGPDLPLAGPPTVRRNFTGMDIGLGRRAGQFTTIPWLVPVTDEESARLAPPEVPVGLEGEGVIAVGRDVTAARPAARVDLWLGRVWSVGTQRVGHSAALARQGPRAVVAADLWASGFRSLTSAGEWSAGAIRSSVSVVTPAPRGLWLARLSGEHLMDPDPDVRRLLMGDDAQHALPPGSRLAEFAVSGSLERTLPLLGARRGFVLDGAMFVAATARWDVAVPLSATARSAGLLEADSDVPAIGSMEHVHLGSVGLGLRLTPTRFGQSTFGLDVGVPLLRSLAVRGRPYFALSIRPAFGRNRGRDSGAVP